MGFGDFLEKGEILDFDTFEHLKSSGSEYRVDHDSTLNVTRRMLVRGSHELWHGRHLSHYQPMTRGYSKFYSFGPIRKQ